MTDGESWGDLYPFVGPLGENLNPSKDSGDVYKTTRNKNVTNFINESETSCHKFAMNSIPLLVESRRIFPRFWIYFSTLCSE